VLWRGWTGLAAHTARAARRVRIRIDCGGRQAELTALCDSGLTAREPRSALPVVPLRPGILDENAPGFRLIPVRTVEGLALRRAWRGSIRLKTGEIWGTAQPVYLMPAPGLNEETEALLPISIKEEI